MLPEGIMKTYYTAVCASFLVVVTFLNYANADTVTLDAVTLNDGTIFNGNVVGMDNTSVVVKTKSRTFSINKDEIRSINAKNWDFNKGMTNAGFTFSNKIIEVDEPMVAGCQFIALVTGTSSGNVVEHAREDALGQAANNGSTHIVWSPTTGGDALDLSGRTYDCSSKDRKGELGAKLDRIKKAFDNGIITAEEYKAKRSQIIKEY